VTTFGLPDLRGRFAVGAGTGPGLSSVALGQVSGSASATMTTNTMPLHTHSVACDGGGGALNDPTNDYPGNAGLGADPSYYSAGPAGAVLNSKALTAVGGSVPFSTQSPFLGFNFIIAINGIFPSRN